MSFSSLPIIDLKADETKIVQDLFTACSTTGFFYLRNHNLFDEQQQMFNLAETFFNLPLEIKEHYPINADNYGYVRFGQENLDSTKQKSIDEKEAFNIQRSVPIDKLPPLFSENNNFQLIEKFYRGCFDLCMILLTYLAKSFQIDSDYFTSTHLWEKESGSTLRLLHYPPVKTRNDESIRAGAHSDYGSITLLFQYKNRSGLEVLDRAARTWHPVQPYDDMIVVNFGDVFEYWSKGFIRSTVHRVVMPIIDPAKDNERYSIAFFCHPNDSTLLSPIPSIFINNRTFETDEHAKHALDYKHQDTLTAGEHLKMRLTKTYAYRTQ